MGFASLYPSYGLRAFAHPTTTAAHIRVGFAALSPPYVLVAKSATADFFAAPFEGRCEATSG